MKRVQQLAGDSRFNAPCAYTAMVEEICDDFVCVGEGLYYSRSTSEDSGETQNGGIVLRDLDVNAAPGT